MREYKIYQLPVQHDNCFMRHSFCEKHGGVNLDDYKAVFTGHIAGDDPHAILELLFQLFNMGDYPKAYTGRSMSVSDVVVIDGLGTYFCDSFGWKKI